MPAKNLPLSILEHGNFYLDQSEDSRREKDSRYLRESGGHYVSDYPVGAALIALPFYAPSVLCGVSPSSRIFSEAEKVSAATIGGALRAAALHGRRAGDRQLDGDAADAHLRAGHQQSQRKQPGVMAARSRAGRAHGGDLLPGTPA